MLPAGVRAVWVDGPHQEAIRVAHVRQERPLPQSSPTLDLLDFALLKPRFRVESRFLKVVSESRLLKVGLFSLA